MSRPDAPRDTAISSVWQLSVPSCCRDDSLTGIVRMLDEPASAVLMYP